MFFFVPWDTIGVEVYANYVFRWLEHIKIACIHTFKFLIKFLIFCRFVLNFIIN